MTAPEAPSADGAMEQVGWVTYKGVSGRSELGQPFLHGHMPADFGGAGPGHEDCQPVYRVIELRQERGMSEMEAVRDALVAVKRFATHCDERNIKVPLWAGMLWDDAIGKVNAALAVLDELSEFGRAEA